MTETTFGTELKKQTVLLEKLLENKK